jgi:hypothetical protein
VYGSRISDATGPYEVVSNGRLVLYQNLFQELEPSVMPDEIVTLIYAPIDILALLREKTGLPYETNMFFPCLHLQGDTVKALEIVTGIVPDLELLNCDDDEVFNMHLAEKETVGFPHIV